MSSAFSLFTGIWPLKTWISRWRQPVEEVTSKANTDSSICEQSKVNGGVSKPCTYCDAESDSALLADHTIQETWLEVSTPATSQYDGSYTTPRSRSDGLSTRYHARAKNDSIRAEQRHGSQADRARSGQITESVSRRETHDVQLSDLVPALERMRDANHKVTQVIFQWNSTAAPLFKQMETIIQSLDLFMHQMTSFADTAGLPENLSSRLGELRRDLEVLRSEHLAPFQANQFQYTATENDIIQTLYRSGRTIDRLLDADASVTSVGELPDPLLGFDVAEIGDNARKRTPEFQRYLSQLEDVDNIRERLTDVHSERSQLLEEQESRAKFGLSLDDESLQFLDASQEQERLLFEELDYAVLVLNALERLVDDEEALHIPDDHPYDEEDEKAGLAEAVGPMTLSDSSVARSIGQQDPLSFQPVLQTRNLKFAEHLAGPSTAPIPPANFINVWLLHRVYSLPGLLRQFTALLDTHGVAGDALSMESIFVTTWFNDSSAADFARHRTFADQQSKLVYMDDTQFLHQRSDAVYARQPASIPLLKMGPSTTAQDIITQAIRARASTLSQSFN